MPASAVQVWSTLEEQVDAVVAVDIAGAPHVVVSTSYLEGNDWSSTLRLLRVDGAALEHVHAVRLPATVGSIAWYAPDVAVCAADDGDLYYCMFDVDAAAWRRLEPDVAHGHNDLITHVATSPERLASASWDRTVKLWDLATMTLVDTLAGHTDKVWGVAWGGDQCATASQDRSVRVWDTRQPGAATTFRTPFAAMCVAWHKDAVTAGLEDGSIWTFDTRASNVTVSTLNQVHKGSVHGVAYAPTGDVLASCSDDTTVAVWDAMTSDAPTQRLVYDEHSDYVHGLAWLDAATLATGSFDKSVHVWQV